jgi:hypothetical protein
VSWLVTPSVLSWICFKPAKLLPQKQYKTQHGMTQMGHQDLVAHWNITHWIYMLLRRDCSIQGLSIPSSTKLNELNFYLLVSLGDYSDLTVFAVLLQARQLFLCSQCIHTIIARKPLLSFC